MPEQVGPDEFVNIRPSRWKARLLFWLAASVLAHGVAALALWRSQGLRDFLFASFREAPQGPQDLEALTAAREVFDRLTRKRMVEAGKRMLVISRDVEGKREREWGGVRDRAASNPHFKAMLDGGLPAIDLLASPGDPASQDIQALYTHARRLEVQVFSLYEQYKAVSLSLSTVRDMRDGMAVPQPLADSLELNRLERPLRPDLNANLLGASDAQLFAIRAVPARMPSPGDPGDPGRPDGFGQWRAEAMRALELCEIMANNCQRILENVNRPGLFTQGGPVSLAPGSSGGPAWTEDNAYRGESLRPADTEPSDLSSVDTKAVMTLGKHLGEREGGNAKAARYLVVDTWWAIGPFEYIGGVRSSESLHHKYPPEVGVDLDATYEGKGGRKLKWEYQPMSKVRQEPRVVMPRALWYFYTEFWSDVDQEVWANIASDDFGALWLNDAVDPVYTSGENPRPWVVLDVKQNVKLRIRRGTNRMLLKLDNNGGTTGMTMIMQLR